MQTTDTLTPRAAAIMDLYIQGVKPGKIAERVGVTARYISEIIHSPQFQDQLAIRREKRDQMIDEKTVNAEIEAAKVLKAHAREAAERMAEMIQSESESVAFKASSDVLDRVGPKKQQAGGAKAAAAVVVIGDADAKLIAGTLEMLEGEVVDGD